MWLRAQGPSPGACQHELPPPFSPARPLVFFPWQPAPPVPTHISILGEPNGSCCKQGGGGAAQKMRCRSWEEAEQGSWLRAVPQGAPSPRLCAPKPASQISCQPLFKPSDKQLNELQQGQPPGLHQHHRAEAT